MMADLLIASPEPVTEAEINGGGAGAEGRHLHQWRRAWREASEINLTRLQDPIQESAQVMIRNGLYSIEARALVSVGR
jgi:hypothetical protein